MQRLRNPERREPEPERHIDVDHPGELVPMDCFGSGRLSGTKCTVWQYTAIDVASAYTWAELPVTPRNPSAYWASGPLRVTGGVGVALALADSELRSGRIRASQLASSEIWAGCQGRRAGGARCSTNKAARALRAAPARCPTLPAVAPCGLQRRRCGSVETRRRVHDARSNIASSLATAILTVEVRLGGARPPRTAHAMSVGEVDAIDAHEGSAGADSGARRGETSPGCFSSGITRRFRVLGFVVVREMALLARGV